MTKPTRPCMGWLPRAVLRTCLLCACLPLWGQATPDEPASSTKQRSATPDWFPVRHITHERWEMVGYGEGNTREEARARAIEDLAGKIIATELDAGSSIRQGTASDGEAMNERMTSLVTSLKGELSNVASKWRGEKDGFYYMALTHDPSSLYQKVERRLKGENPCPGGARNPKTKTLGMKFSRDLEQQFGCVPEWGLVYRSDVEPRRWELHMPELKSSPILRAHDVFETWFLPRSNSNVLNINLSTKDKEVVADQDVYNLTITNRREGWLYLFAVTEQGQVRRHQFGQGEVKVGERTYPNPDDFDGMFGYINDESRKSQHELYLAALCDQELADYESLGRGFTEEYLEDDPKTYRYGRLLEAVRRQSCAVDSDVLVITNPHASAATKPAAAR